jgi:hypothetical protein
MLIFLPEGLRFVNLLRLSGARSRLPHAKELDMVIHAGP